MPSSKKLMYKFKREIIAPINVTVETTLIPHTMNKHQTCKKYIFHLECGHTMTQYSQGAGRNPLNKKSILCDYCAEEYINDPKKYKETIGKYYDR